MLEYSKDGKKIECKAIYGKGRVGQVVILSNVSFGENPNFKEWPLAKYAQPYAFTIIEKVEGKDGYYTVTDVDGNHITLQDQYYGASESYLYDANEWLAWQKGCTKEKLRLKEEEIQHLESQKDLLKSILVSQGFRVISENQAKKLGIS